MLNSALVMF